MQLKHQKPSAEALFRACSDSTRLRILNVLRSGGEVCVCDLVSTIGGPQPKISRHLAYLRRSGLVTARKQGLWSYYSLAPARGVLHRKLLECLANCGVQLPQMSTDAKRYRDKCCGDNCCA
jgi:ArsR family transcriptional regulator, arsenate/arsenite/antimonite-responsive transcriptional repressor